MPNVMQGWIEQFEKLLEERSGAALTVTPEVTEPRPAALFLSTITLDGPMRGVLRIAVPDAEMVQFAQLAGRRPLDAQVALDEGILAEWKNLLEESAARLTAHMLAEGEGEYKAVLREMRAADAEVGAEADAEAGADAIENAGADPGADSGADTKEAATAAAMAGESAVDSAVDSADGVAQSSYVLRAGEIALRIAIQTRMEPAAPDMSSEATLDAAPTSKEADAAAAKTAEFVARQVADIRAAEAQAAEESMNRAATAAEARAARRRSESNLEESSLFRTHPERLDLLLDIELEATLRFGAVEMPLRKVLELGPGDVLQLDRHVQEPVDLVVGDRIVARGEVVLVGGNFGLHVTEVAEPRRRLETIRCLF